MFKGSLCAYYAMYLVGFAVMMLVSRRTCARYGVGKKEATSCTLLAYVAGVAGAMLMGRIFTAVSAAVGEPSASGVAIFGAVIFSPLILLAALRMMKLNVAAMFDLLTPGIFLILTCAKFGCALYGCCPGIPWDRGIYNPHVGEKVFPVQICEVLTMAAVILLTQWFVRRSRRFRPGMAYPLTAGAYAFTRFFWEFARYYDSDRMRHFFLGMSFWQLACILTFAVSAVLLSVIRKKTPANRKSAMCA